MSVILQPPRGRSIVSPPPTCSPWNIVDDGYGPISPLKPATACSPLSYEVPCSPMSTPMVPFRGGTLIYSPKANTGQQSPRLYSDGYAGSSAIVREGSACSGAYRSVPTPQSPSLSLVRSPLVRARELSASRSPTLQQREMVSSQTASRVRSPVLESRQTNGRQSLQTSSPPPIASRAQSSRGAESPRLPAWNLKTAAPPPISHPPMVRKRGASLTKLTGHNLQVSIQQILSSTQSQGTCSAAVATGHSTAPTPCVPSSLYSSLQVNSLEFDDLNLDYTFFDPVRQPLKGQLLQKMRIHANASVEPIRGMAGGCNAGMWILRDGSQSFILKLVRTLPSFMGPQQPSESEKFAKLYREHPEMAKDPSLSFPCNIFHCRGKGGSKTHDLVVMRQVPGARVSDVIMQKLHSQQVQDLMRVLYQFGLFLADFHERYNGLQHGDLTPANAFFDEHSSKFTLVDVSDIAPRNPVIQSDVDRFTGGLKLLSHFYGAELWIEGKTQFEAGYNARRCGRRPSPFANLDMPERSAPRTA